MLFKLCVFNELDFFLIILKMYGEIHFVFCFHCVEAKNNQIGCRRVDQVRWLRHKGCVVDGLGRECLQVGTKLPVSALSEYWHSNMKARLKRPRFLFVASTRVLRHAYEVWSFRL